MFKEYLWSVYDTFVPPWKWLHELKQTKKKKMKYQYNTIAMMCRKSQFILGILAIMFLASFERTRQIFCTSTSYNGIPFFLSDLGVYAILAYFLGLKRTPSNFVSLIIVRAFAVLEENAKPAPGHFNYRVHQLGPSRDNGEWAVLTYKPVQKPLLPVPTFGSSALMIVILVGFWIVKKYNDFNMSQYKGTLLILENLISSWAAIMLLSSLVLDAIPDIKENHLKMCELWLLFAFPVLFLVLFSAFERVIDSISGSGRLNMGSLGDWEGFIFIFVFAATYRYLPKLHKSLRCEDIVANKLFRLLNFCTPGALICLWNRLLGLFT